MNQERDKRPRVRLGFNPKTGQKEYIVIEPKVYGYGFMQPWQYRATRLAYVIKETLNQERENNAAGS